MATDTTVPDTRIPTLRAGERLTRTEFERVWNAMPEVKKAELINGVVYTPALSIDHAAPHFDLITWLGLYRILTPGVGGADNASIRFDDNNMPQPDALLRILESHGGRSRVAFDRYLEGGPELIAEVANTTTDKDIVAKRDLYRQFGVQEYIVWQVAEPTVEWFALRKGHYWTLEPGTDGIIRSEVFPGLWLDPAAIVTGDAARLLTVAQQGHGSPEHTTFIAELRRRTSNPT